MVLDLTAAQEAKLHSRRTVVVFVVGCLLAILAISWISLAARPAGMSVAAWWPASGVVLGLGISFPRRYLLVLAPAVGVVTLLASLAGIDRPVDVSIGLSVCVAVEMVVGTLLLRGRSDSTPTLSSVRDLGRLLIAAGAAPLVYGLLAGGLSFLVDPALAWERLITSAPKHAAGIVLLTPLFMRHPPRPRQVGLLHTVAQFAVALGLAMYVFFIAGQLQLAFLTFVPVVWAALTLSTRLMLIEVIAICTIAVAASSNGYGPWSFTEWAPRTASMVLQIFELAIGIVFLLLSLALGQERDTARRLNESEEIFRRVFDGSVAGKLIVSHGDDGWTVRRSNPSARAMLPALADGHTGLAPLLGEQASAELSVEADKLGDDRAEVKLTTDSGRVLHFSMVPIPWGEQHRVLALQFYDVTEATRARELEEAELERAAEVQRALLPWRLPSAPGWQAAALSLPAKTVCGDFYDLRLDGQDAVLSLGDVMGKGMGAGMLAAATRAALRTTIPQMSPASAVRSAASALDGDLQRSSAFVTLAHVHVNLQTGAYRIADAGHGLHFIVRDCGNSVEHVRSADMPIGLGNDWHELRGTLAPGDAILLVSDGVLDLWGGTVEGLHAKVSESVRLHCGDAHALINALCMGGSGTIDIDDVTALILGREPVPAMADDDRDRATAPPVSGMS